MIQTNLRTYTVRLDKNNWTAISNSVSTYASSKSSDDWQQWAKRIEEVIQTSLAQTPSDPVPVTLDEVNWNSVKTAILEVHQNSTGFWKQWSTTMVSLIATADVPQYGASPQSPPLPNQMPNAAGAVPMVAPAPAAGQQQAIPKCTRCGTITPWTVGPLFRPLDWVLFFVFLLFAGGGFIYMLIVFLIRNDPNNREKICPRCGAQNMWTFIY